MSAAGCSLAALLRSGGPVRVEVRPCCLVALVGRRVPPDGSASPVEPIVCAAAESEATVGAGGPPADFGTFVATVVESGVAR